MKTGRHARSLQRLVMPRWLLVGIFATAWVCVCITPGPICATAGCILGYWLGRFLVWVARTLIQARAARFMCDLNGTDIDDLMAAAERIRKNDKLKAECIRKNAERKRHNDEAERTAIAETARQPEVEVEV